MIPVISSISRVLCFPHQGKVVIIDQLEYCMLNCRNKNGMNVSFVNGSLSAYDSVCVELFKDS